MDTDIDICMSHWSIAGFSAEKSLSGQRALLLWTWTYKKCQRGNGVEIESIDIHTYIIHNSSRLHYIIAHYITLHYITLHYITLHYITLHDMT